MKDKLKNLKKKIEDNFGKGSIFFLDEGDKGKVDVVPTGILSLDKVLGCGGIPRGRIIELIGSEASGKCLTKDTYISTENGLETIEEIFINNNVVPSCSNKETEKAVLLKNENNQNENTTHFVSNGRRKVFKITTESGIEQKCTQNHPWKTVGKTGFLEWQKTKDLKTGDYLCLQRGVLETSSISSEEANKAYFLGILTADAHFDDNRIMICNNDPFITSFIENEGTSILGVIPKKHDRKENNTTSYQYSSKVKVNEFYKEYGLKPCISKEKYVPKNIRINKNLWIPFLKGYIDCKGYLGSSLEVASASYQLIYEVKLMLQLLGSVSSVSKKVVKNYEHNAYYKLQMSGVNLFNYLNNVGTNRIEWKSYDFSRVLIHNQDHIPFQRDLVESLLTNVDTDRISGKLFTDLLSNKVSLSYNRLEKIVHFFKKEIPSHILVQHLSDILEKNYYYDKIVSIEYFGEEPVFDFVMETSHSFVANGTISHNTSLALNIIARFQEQGLVAAYIDVEHALDKEFATMLGVNTKEMLFAQPDTTEEALGQIDTIARTGEVGVIVLDSVAAMCPTVELEGEYTDSHMGVQARLMGKGMRKLTGILSKTNTTLICINQWRDKIGVMFGDPKTTPGGNALKFYSTIRLEISKSAQQKDGDKLTGHTMGIKIMKNKLSAPTVSKIEVPVTYGVGFDFLGDALNVAIKEGVVEQSGNTYSFNGEKLGVGINRTRKFLIDNQEIYDKIVSRLKASKDGN